jgi:hypothetical protein
MAALGQDAATIHSSFVIPHSSFSHLTPHASLIAFRITLHSCINLTKLFI